MKHLGDRSAATLWLLAICAAAIGVRLNAFGNGFVLDDTVIIEGNERIRSLGSVGELFLSNYWGPHHQGGLYRPAVLLTYAANYAFGGLDTTGYTAVNLLVHAAVCGLLFRFMVALGIATTAAGLASLLFAVHPAHSEAVVGFVGRADTLAALGVVGTALLHRSIPHYRDARGIRLLALLSLSLALLSKESAVTCVGVLVAMDWLLPATDRTDRPVSLRDRLWPDYAAYCGVLLAYVALRIAVLGVPTGDATILFVDNPIVEATTGLERFGTPFAAIAEYARLLVWPARLSADYSYAQIPLVQSPLDARLWLGLAISAATLVGIVMLRVRNAKAAFGLAFLAITFSTTSNLLVVIGTICAERLLYLPSIGVAIALASALDPQSLPRRAWRTALIAVCLASLVAGGVRSAMRNEDWHDSLALWESSTAAAPNSMKTNHNLGNELRGIAQQFYEQGDTEQAAPVAARAETHLRKAIGIYPHAPSLSALATLLAHQGRRQEAFVLYEQATQLKPDLQSAWNDWGVALEREAASLRRAGQTAEALEYAERAEEALTRAIALRADSVNARFLRGRLRYRDLEDPHGAAEDYRRVLELVPNHPARRSMESVVSIYGGE